MQEILFGLSSGIILLSLSVIGWLLSKFYEETKLQVENNKRFNDKLISEMSGINQAIMSLKKDIITQEKINQELKDKDSELWEEMKELIERINNNNELTKELIYNLNKSMAEMRAIIISHINNKNIHKE